MGDVARAAMPSRRKAISRGVYFNWPNDHMAARKRRRSADTVCAANTVEVKELRQDAKDLTGEVAEQRLEL